MDIVRKTKTAVTLFPYFKDTKGEFRVLVLKRGIDKLIDPGLINGVGGKIEALNQGENALQAAVRELQEETGIRKSEADFEYLGHMHFVGGYPDDWVSFFFRVCFSEEEYTAIQSFTKTNDGDLLWFTEEELRLRNDLVLDLPFVLHDICESQRVFFSTACMGLEGKIIEKFSIFYILKNT